MRIFRGLWRRFGSEAAALAVGTSARTRVLLALALVTLVAAFSWFFCTRSLPLLAPVNAHPNFVLVVSDDEPIGMTASMPALSALAKSGTVFTNFFISDPLCCPSRATILRGQYQFNHGCVQDSCAKWFHEHLAHDTLATRLKAAGYTTGLAGKYLNHYGESEPLAPPQGWDKWLAYYHPGGEIRRFDATFNHDGEITQIPGYGTDVIMDYAAALAGSAPEPFLLVVTPHSPHRPLVPAVRHAGLFSRNDFRPPPSYAEADVSDKPRWVRNLKPLTKSSKNRIAERWRAALQMMQSVDEGIARILKVLDDRDIRERTIVVYLSDNGFHYGEHGIAQGKGTPYDASLRVPLIIQGPGWKNQIRPDFATNADIAPTILSIAGVEIPSFMDGRPILTPTTRQSIPIENDESPLPVEWRGFRGQLKYIELRSGEKEFYRMDEDPGEMTNLWPTLTVQRKQALHEHLLSLFSCAGESCRIREDQPLP